MIFLPSHNFYRQKYIFCLMLEKSKSKLGSDVQGQSDFGSIHRRKISEFSGGSQTLFLVIKSFYC